MSDDMSLSMDNFMYESQSAFDFTSVALYVPVIQIVVATVASCISALLLTWLPFGASNAVRTLAVASVVGLVPIVRPIRVAKTRGLDALFTMIRPVVLVYLLSMVVEQLGHSCEQWQSKSVGTWREVWYHVVVFAMMVAGFVRSYALRVDDDMPLIVTCGGLLLVALVPHSAHEYGGPLCASSSLFHATERVARAFLFATVYCVIAFTGEILMPRPNGLFVASIRACGASVWILACSVWILPLAILQVVIVVWTRVRQTDEFESLPMTSLEDSDAEADLDAKSFGYGNGGLGNGINNDTNGIHDIDTGGFRLSLKGQIGMSDRSYVGPSADQMRQLADAI